MRLYCDRPSPRAPSRPAPPAQESIVALQAIRKSSQRLALIRFQRFIVHFALMIERGSSGVLCVRDFMSGFGVMCSTSVTPSVSSLPPDSIRHNAPALQWARGVLFSDLLHPSWGPRHNMLWWGKRRQWGALCRRAASVSLICRTRILPLTQGQTQVKPRSSPCLVPQRPRPTSLPPPGQRTTFAVVRMQYSCC